MESRLKIKLYPGWRPLENPNGPATYVRGAEPNPSALQFSVARRRAGPFHESMEERLVNICKQATGSVKDRMEISQSSGPCDFGVFGTVIVAGSSPAYMQAWVVSNQQDFILITHICEKRPDAQEIEEAQAIALMTRCT